MVSESMNECEWISKGYWMNVNEYLMVIEWMWMNISNV